MFDEILPGVYKRLRLEAGLSQGQLAEKLGASRQTVVNYESGATRPDAKRERALAELSGCSREEIVEIFCEEASRALDLKVAIVPENAMEVGERLLRRRGEMPPGLAGALKEKMHTAGLVRLAGERLSDEVETIVAACREAMGGGSKTGTTGAARGRPVSNSRDAGRATEDHRKERK